MVEELQRVGAEVHLAEPAEAAALKGEKKRAKTDWGDARHLRELLLIGRPPESWIPPAHILDLRARVRTRVDPLLPLGPLMGEPMPRHHRLPIRRAAQRGRSLA